MVQSLSKVGHTIEGCFELVGCRDWWNVQTTNIKTQPREPKSQPRAANITKTEEQNITKDEYNELMPMLRMMKAHAHTPDANMAGKTFGTPNLNLVDMSKNSWVIDSWASEHINAHKSWLKNIKINKDVATVTIPNVENIPVEGIGDVQLSDGLKLNHVLNIPYFKCNLMSVSRLTRDLQCSITFLPELFHT